MAPPPACLVSSGALVGKWACTDSGAGQRTRIFESLSGSPLQLFLGPLNPDLFISRPCCADKGVDRVLSAQGALTRDTVYLVNGAQVGDRDIITVGVSSSFGSSSITLCVASFLRVLMTTLCDTRRAWLLRKHCCMCVRMRTNFLSCSRPRPL